MDKQEIFSLDKLLTDFDEVIPYHLQFCEKLAMLVAEILNQAGISVHSVSGRAKTKHSFRKKLEDSAGKYESIDQVTDITGVRIITYFEDDVDKVAELIERDFAVDTENSIDRRALLDPDKFGYLSLHYVIRLSDARTSLAEYARCKGLPAEIQVRSILQHAWAEIEHDLGYKTALGIPRDIRRQFSALAGLLEIADGEFVRIRDILRRYEEELPDRIEEDPTDILIDRASLTAFVASNPLVRRIGEKIAKLLKCPYEEGPDLDRVENMVTALSAFDLATLGHLERTLGREEEKILALAQAIIESLSGEHPHVRPTISLLYLTYLLSARSRDRALAEQVYVALGFSAKRFTKFWERLQAGYEKIVD